MRKQKLVNKSLLNNISDSERSATLWELKAVKAPVQKFLRETQNFWWDARSAEVQQAADVHGL